MSVCTKIIQCVSYIVALLFFILFTRTCYFYKSFTFHMFLTCIDLIAYPVPTSSLRYLTCCPNLVTSKTAEELRDNCLWRVLKFSARNWGEISTNAGKFGKLKNDNSCGWFVLSHQLALNIWIRRCSKKFKVVNFYVTRVNQMNFTNKNWQKNIFVIGLIEKLFCSFCLSRA